MRNRVAHNDVQPTRALGRVAVLTILPIVLLAATAAVASAAPLAVDGQGGISLGIAGPVGIVAVAIGALGVVAGLLRHRRRVNLARALARPTAVAPETAAPTRVS